MENWRWIPYQRYTAAENMAIDEAMMIQHREKDIPPTIRFYGWRTPTCSLGYFQQINRELVLEEIKQQGFSYVRRMTGGRTVFHDQELTYSLVVSSSHPLFSMSVRKSVQQVSQALLVGFQSLGLNAEIAPPRVKEDRRTMSSACFDLASDYEVTIEGKKVVGSAQTRQQDVLLQHGSILLDLDVDLFFRLLAFPSEAVRQRMQRVFRKRAGAINDFVSSRKTMAELSDAFVHGFENGMEIKLVEGELTDSEKTLAKQLQADKYETYDWNHKR